MGRGSAAQATDLPRSGRATAELNASLGRRLTASAAVAGLLLAVVVHAALPNSPFEMLPPKGKQAVAAVVPEGWAFFTRNPRLPSLVPYQFGPDSRWHSVAAGRNTRSNDAMGVDRAGRAQGVELAILVEHVPGSVWHRCGEDPLVCLSNAQVSATFENVSHRTICGDVGFVVQDVLPWAWRYSPALMPSKVVRVRVTC
jgi:antimicrobial peptide system SdpA family protein